MKTNTKPAAADLILSHEQRYLELHAAKARIEKELEILKAVLRPLAAELFTPPDTVQVGRFTFSCKRTLQVKQMPAIRHLRGLRIAELEAVFPAAFELKFGPRRKDDLVERFGEVGWSEVVVGVTK